MINIRYACTTIRRYPFFSARYAIMCIVYTGYHGTSEIEHDLCSYTVDNPLAQARGLSPRTGAQIMLYFPIVVTIRMMGQGDYLPMPRVVCLVIYFPFELLVIRRRNDKSKVCCLLNKNCLTCPGRSRGRRTKKRD